MNAGYLGQELSSGIKDSRDNNLPEREWTFDEVCEANW